MRSCTAVRSKPTPFRSRPHCDCRHHKAHVHRISADFFLLRPADIIGHVGVDFVALQEGSKLRMWAVDLKLQPTASLCSFQVWGHTQSSRLSDAHVRLCWALQPCSNAAATLTYSCGCGLLLGIFSTWAVHVNGKKQHPMHYAASSAAFWVSIWRPKQSQCLTDVCASAADVCAAADCSAFA